MSASRPGRNADPPPCRALASISRWMISPRSINSRWSAASMRSISIRRSARVSRQEGSIILCRFQGCLGCLKAFCGAVGTASGLEKQTRPNRNINHGSGPSKSQARQFPRNDRRKRGIEPHHIPIRNDFGHARLQPMRGAARRALRGATARRAPRRAIPGRASVWR